MQVEDGHPDAHASRMRMWLSFMDAPQEVKMELFWDMPSEVYKYIMKVRVKPSP
jgi:hypothetical protein